ncbi:MAG: tRNA dihydrouridine synthase DusB [Holosporales bacterium]|jgi:tRNA-dihydrouridine synthase B|nr:tRNA dihydrouridine synthase DusB [Holosporales bacterium]
MVFARQFSIGNITFSSPVILAPMSGITDFPFREIVRSFGVGLVFSEMTASRAVIESLKNLKVRKRLHFFDATKEKHPIAIQIVGCDPDIMVTAAKFNEQCGANIIDINMGCPVKKVVNTYSGAALMKNEILAGKIIEAVVKAVSIPVTVKMRLGWDSENLNAANIAKIAENSGAQCITVHGRTRSQFYEGAADWKAIRAIKESIKIPLIGNGDVYAPQDAEQLLQDSGADAVMVGRGTFGRPWLCKKIADYLPTNIVSDYFKSINLIHIIRKHIQMIIEEYGEIKGIFIARKHLGWYSKGIQNSANFRQAVNKLEKYKDLEFIIEDFFGNLPCEN